MEISSQIYILVFITFCFCFYKLLMRMSRKRNSKSLWHPEDENDLNDLLNRIYTSSDLESLRGLLAEGIRCHPRYHDLFKVAIDERHLQITKNSPVLSFEEKESKTRKTWVFSFYANYCIYWISFVVTIFLIDSPNEGPLVRLAAVIPCTVLIGIMMWIVYYCAYKKKGTGLLSWIVIMSPLQLISSFAKEGIDLSLWYLTVFDLALFGFYWFSSFRLRRINYEVKARRQLDGLRKNMCVFENAENTAVTC